MRARARTNNGNGMRAVAVPDLYEMLLLLLLLLLRSNLLRVRVYSHKTCELARHLDDVNNNNNTRIVYLCTGCTTRCSSSPTAITTLFSSNRYFNIGTYTVYIILSLQHKRPTIIDVLYSAPYRYYLFTLTPIIIISEY